MRVVECQLIEDCIAPKRMGNGVLKKSFRRGQKVQGTVTNIALTPESQVVALKTKEGYLIPEPFLNILGEVKSGKKKRRQSEPQGYEDMVEAEIMEDAKPPKSDFKSISESLKASDIIGGNSVKSKYSVNFALGGAVVGVVYAMMKGGNKLIFAAIGAIGGGIAGNYVGKKIIKNETTK